MIAMHSSCFKMNAAVTLGLIAALLGSGSGNSLTYRAGVVEYKPVPHNGNDKETMLRNAELIAGYAKQAAQQNVDIIAFPEYGITTFDDNKLDTQVQDVPNPKLVEWNPCLEPHKFHNESNEVLHEISCAAHNNSVAILVNLLSREACSRATDPRCPEGDHYFYNTNIIFGKNGSLLYTYHKYHRFGEEDLNSPAEAEYPIVDLGFAKIASFICFDIFYKEPPVDLVEKHNVRNIIFSTAWINELPFNTAPQLMSQLAHGVGANILATNMYYPEITRLGSGIYSSYNGALNESWDLATPSRMIVADVPVNPPTAAEEWTTCSETVLATENPQAKPESCIDPVLNWSSNVQSVMTDIPSSIPMTNKTHKIYYEPLSNYSYINLPGREGSVDVCQGKFCCNATYEFSTRDDNDIYVLVVRNGCRMFGKYNIGLQMCAILRCNTSDNIESCGRVPESQPISRFSRLSISGYFQTTHIFPNIFSTTFYNVPRELYQFKKQLCQERSLTAVKAKATLETTSALPDHPVMVASLYGRMYNWD